MPVKCQLIMEALEQLAPRRLAQSWDTVGLLVGSPDQNIHGVMVALDLCDATIADAVTQRADLIVTHHPAIFKPLRSIRTDCPQGVRLQTLLKHNMAVVSAHTNLDVASGGVNDVLAGALGLSNIRGLREESRQSLLKLAVFVPPAHADRVRQAIAQAGAGHIGNYSHCTFQVAGMGTFMPLAGTSPYIGEQDKLSVVEECRLETILPEQLAPRVIAAMLSAHPYEEVAYDLYPLQNQGAAITLGRMGELAKPAMLGELAGKVKERLGAAFVRVCGDMHRLVSRIAVCGGSGADLIEDAAQAGADVLITGDVKYHEAQQAIDSGVALIDAGHFCTERPVIAAVADYLGRYAEARQWDLRIMASASEQDIFSVI